MKRFIIALMLVCPMVASAEIPAVTQLFGDYASNENVTIAEVDKALIQMAMGASATEEDMAILSEIDAISIMECSDATTCEAIASAINDIVGNEELSQLLNVDDDESDVGIYAKPSGDNFSDIVIVVKQESQVVIVNIKGGFSPETLSSLLSSMDDTDIM